MFCACTAGLPVADSPVDGGRVISRLDCEFSLRLTPGISRSRFLLLTSKSAESQHEGYWANDGQQRIVQLDGEIPRRSFLFHFPFDPSLFFNIEVSYFILCLENSYNCHLVFRN